MKFKKCFRKIRITSRNKPNKIDNLIKEKRDLKQKLVKLKNETCEQCDKKESYKNSLGIHLESCHEGNMFINVNNVGIMKL